MTCASGAERARARTIIVRNRHVFSIINASQLDDRFRTSWKGRRTARTLGQVVCHSLPKWAAARMSPLVSGVTNCREITGTEVMSGCIRWASAQLPEADQD